MVKFMKDITAKLMEATGRTEQDCAIINEILGDRFIIGHNQKAKIIDDFAEKLNISAEEADKLYNKCSEVIAKGIFGK